MSVTAEQKEFAMGLVAGMMIEDRAKRERRTCKELFCEFRRSNTMKMLFDDRTGVWECGPAYLSDEWTMERAKAQEAQR